MYLIFFFNIWQRTAKYRTYKNLFKTQVLVQIIEDWSIMYGAPDIDHLLWISWRIWDTPMWQPYSLILHMHTLMLNMCVFLDMFQEYPLVKMYLSLNICFVLTIQEMCLYFFWNYKL